MTTLHPLAGKCQLGQGETQTTANRTGLKNQSDLGGLVLST